MLFSLPIPKSAAFSLVELLVVLTVVGLLVVAAIPAFNAFSASHGVRKCAYDVAGLLEMARSEAVARQTYVWVGFGTTNRGGVDEVYAGAVFSRDGSGTNTSAANLGGLSRILRFPKIALAGWTDLRPEVQAEFSGGVPSGMSTNTAGAPFSLGTVLFQKTMAFSPRGEATLAGHFGLDDGFDPAMEISFRESRGGVVPPNASEAAVIVDGATGTPRIYGLP